LEPTGRIESVALLNISASEVTIKFEDSIDGIIYNETFNMTSDSGISDWWAYFFEPIVRGKNLVVTGAVALYSNPTITITATDSGENVLIGTLIIGASKEIGYTQYGANVGIRDYSVKTTDVFGNYTILERAYSKTANFTVWIEASKVDVTHDLLSSYRATAILYLGSDSYQSSWIYGFYQDFDIVLSRPTTAMLNIKVEGLT